jgi:hypothetical protein
MSSAPVLDAPTFLVNQYHTQGRRRWINARFDGHFLDIFALAAAELMISFIEPSRRWMDRFPWL